MKLINDFWPYWYYSPDNTDKGFQKVVKALNANFSTAGFTQGLADKFGKADTTTETASKKFNVFASNQTATQFKNAASKFSEAANDFNTAAKDTSVANNASKLDAANIKTNTWSYI